MTDVDIVIRQVFFSEYVSLDSQDRLNIIGLLDGITLPVFPCIVPVLSLAAEFRFVSLHGNNLDTNTAAGDHGSFRDIQPMIAFALVDFNGRQINTNDTTIISFSPRWIISYFHGITFQEPGEYTIQLFQKDIHIYSHLFTVNNK